MEGSSQPSIDYFALNLIHGSQQRGRHYFLMFFLLAWNYLHEKKENLRKDARLILFVSKNGEMIQNGLQWSEIELHLGRFWREPMKATSTNTHFARPAWLHDRCTRPCGRLSPEDSSSRLSWIMAQDEFSLHSGSFSRQIPSFPFITIVNSSFSVK